MKQKTITIPSLGDVLLIKSPHTTRLHIRLKPLEGIQVSFPEWVSFQEAQKVVHQKKDWILKHLPKMQKLKEAYTIFDQNSQFQTRFHELRFIEGQKKDYAWQIRPGETKIYCPHFNDIKSNPVQAMIREALEETWRREAKQMLPPWVNSLAQVHNFQYQKLFIKNSKTRWGSCSGKNNINLSLHLMRLPDHLIEYVILHELCHTIHKNHGPHFWKLLDKVSGNAKGLDKELSQYYIKIY